jgi:anti-sigma factor RsiW
MSTNSCGRVVALLPEYGVAALPDKRRAEVAAHLGTCESCRRELAALERTGGLLDETAPRRPSRDLWPAIEGRLSERRRVPAWWTGWLWNPRARQIAATAALLLVIVLVGALVHPVGWPTPATAPLAHEVDTEAPLYAAWYAEASMASPLADRYALAVVVSSGPKADAEARSQ